MYLYYFLDIGNTVRKRYVTYKLKTIVLYQSEK